MAGGLAALLDDVAMIAKSASATSTKAAALVVDDTAVTPQYVTGISPARELPIIWKIAKGSLVNKAILIVLLMLLDQFLPVVLTPLLMLGGLYLSFEGAEKVIEALGGNKEEHAEQAAEAGRGAAHEKKLAKSAITTDFILSAEIMVISLSSLNAAQGGDMGPFSKALTLALVGLLVTAGVYGLVGLLVKLDDIGLAMEESDRESRSRFGRALVSAMPKVLAVLETVGMAAMLWVGGHILLNGADELGWHAPYGLLHLVSEPAHHMPVVGAFLGWLVDALGSAIVAFVIGAVLAGIAHVLPFRRHHDEREPEGSASGEAGTGGTTGAGPQH